MVTEKQSSSFDIIGDVHGHCDALETLLQKMGYRREEGSYQHPERTAVFVGDLIDRGPKIRETLEVVKAMADSGTALVTLGNHEYNAVAYCTHGEDGEWLRSHSKKNQRQFQATLDAFEDHPEEWKRYLDWFRSWPLYLDLDGFRVVHACWSQRHIDLVANRRLNDRDFLLASARQGTPEFHAVETLLKGPEIALSPGTSFADKEGNIRTETRVKWWRSLSGLSYRDASFPEQASLSDNHIDTSMVDEPWDIYASSAPPVFVGHYWLPPQTPQPFANVICLDYSVAKDGFLTAYRWDSGGEIRDDGFETVFP